MMKAIERCQRCVLPVSLPSVTVDEDGVCNHCRTHERLMTAWESSRDQRHRDWQHLVHSAKKRGRAYDCLVPLSGGKDSTYALYACSKLYGMKCISVTFDNGFLTDMARQNMARALDAAGADHVTVRTNPLALRRLDRLFIERCGTFCPVCMRGIDESMQAVRRAYKVPLTVTGGGRRIAYLGVLPELLQNGERRFFSKVVYGTPLWQDAARIGCSRVQAKMPRLALRIRNRIRRLGRPGSVGLYDYLDVSRTDVLRTITDEMGWRKVGAQFEHTDCKMHHVATHIHRLRFPQLTQETAHRSGQIRMGEITRDEALKLEEADLENPRVPENLPDLLEQLDMSREEFERCARNWSAAQFFRA